MAPKEEGLKMFEKIIFSLVGAVRNCQQVQNELVKIVKTNTLLIADLFSIIRSLSERISALEKVSSSRELSSESKKSFQK